eukprot:CAMPEP_0113875358 /NCGR_PEP_ID=MMETSP0780_2-20120614/4906_1 /TAXON_ID=652834 /ORGANISM="Palpitomonas bilix" /LENGTH=38 /DNA_ID=CAMNT_0000861355 /DNA_START=79 /DNA_END=192 /DNA_ORIENTATION=+ /assembly_acc=CAM_ASM_000599
MIWSDQYNNEQGDFVDNMFHGNGKYTWPNKTAYEGEWK